ncbi:hypothetical protein UlMin_031067 [Ulmus minor]
MSFDSARSAGSSGQRSKRSINSSYSNPSSASNTKKQKKNTNQKTLGAVWGSNSLSSSRSSFAKSPFSSFGSYMVEKNRKLQNQFNGEASSSEHTIFRGVSIFVDGFTVPSSKELKGYMLKYGGRYENYFSRNRVTHIICSNLPNSKLKNLRSFSGGLPVVKPTWVLDSVAASKLLSWVPYQLEQLADNQPRLSAFYAPKNSCISEDAVLAKHEIEHATSDGDMQEDDDNSSEMGEALDYKQQNDAGSDEMGEKYCEMKITDTDNFDPEGDSNGKDDDVRTSPFKNSASVSSHSLDNQDKKGLPSSAPVGTNPLHSTLTDPNFVENYFKNSRLHFIGTWRNRYRKRFPGQSKGFKDLDSNVNALVDPTKTTIIHIDMDCFFVSVVIRKHPELKDKPVAVCHSDNPKGTAEISSANYPARDYGVRAGMFVRDAKALCPGLIIVPYNFKAYEEVADQLYNILHKHSKKVQAVSCDEAFLEVNNSAGEDPEVLASTIRKEIFEITRCTASAGIAGNMLLSRLATRTAKPDGQCYIPPEKVDDYLHQLPIKALPGIGYVLEEKLKRLNVKTCGELRNISKDSLRKDFGVKTGEMLWNYCRGIDKRLVGMIQESKSVGAEVNWGVRFKDLKDTQHFLSNLCKEVSLRLQGCGVMGRTFTLKIKKRRKDADEPAKYMGCGACENLSHSLTVPVATDDVEVLQRITKQLFGVFNMDVQEIRGMGLQVSKLENFDPSKQGPGKNSLKSWLKSSGSADEQYIDYVPRKEAIVESEDLRVDRTPARSCEDVVFAPNSGNNCSSIGEPILSSNSGPPPLCHLDSGVIESLPPEIFSELNEIYGGNLAEFLAKRKGSMNGGNRLGSNNIPVNKISKEDKGKQHRDAEVNSSVGGSNDVAFVTVDLEKADLMPSSLSQVDISVLQQLPQELRVDILEQLPAHRNQDPSSSSSLSPVKHPKQLLAINNTENNAGSTDTVAKYKLWFGNPPKWVDEFRESNCVILNFLSKMYYKSGPTGNLSSILRFTILESYYLPEEGYEGWDESVQRISELLKQYVELKIELDIEEIYICFRLLRRFISKSKLFLCVYNNAIPYLQASVSECYGGDLHLPAA